jgi:prepilin-type N-terminal cleavage/methylation domain-containing protein
MRAAGFSLVEVLVATAVVAVGVASLAPLFVVSVRTGRIAHTTSTTLLSAQQKMEALRADAAASSLSPSATLSANTQGYFDYIDRIGVSVSGDPAAPPGSAVYVRRWAIEPLEGGSGNEGGAIVLKVLVLQLAGGPSGKGSRVARAPGETRLVSVKTRKAG